MKNHKSLVKILTAAIGIIVFIIISGIFLLRSEIPAQSPIVRQQTTFDPAKYVAVVNNAGIKRSLYNTRKAQLERFAIWITSQKTTSNAVSKDLVGTLIEEELATQFVKKQNLLPGSTEVEKRYLAAVASVGTEKQYLKKIQEIQGVNKEELLSRMRVEMIEERIEKKTHMPFSVWVKEEKKKANIQRVPNEYNYEKI